MNRLLKLAAALLLGLLPGWSADQTKTSAPSKAPAAKVPAVKAPATPSVSATPRIPAHTVPPVFQSIPNTQVQRFLRMTPQEREIAIDKLPVPQQDALRKRLERWDALPANEREHQLKLFDTVSKLPKETQDLINQRVADFSKLPAERRKGISYAYQLLSAQPEDARRSTIESQGFKDRYTPTEQQIIIDLVKYYPTPRL